ncbi:MAG: AAA family ATPase, partial [Treponema sp.]|nr:AAA family ATPase [Treponema sp.]
VDGIIPEIGLHLLVAAEKVGKSWFTLQCAQGIATGESVFGKIPVNKNKVLFISLEESCHLLLMRAKSLNFPKSGNNLKVVDDIDHYEFRNPPDVLDQMLKSDPSIRFIIIDTLQLFLDLVDMDRIGEAFFFLNDLKAIAYTREVSILMVQYAKRVGLMESMNSIARALGRNDLLGLCDSTIYLTRLRTERRADIFVTGRDIIGKVYSLRLDDNRGWVFEGDKREVVEGDTQKLIAEWIKENGEAQPIDIYKRLKAEGYTGTHDTIRKTCCRMKDAGKLKRSESGTYSLFTPPATPVTVSQSEDQECDALIPPATPVTVSQSEDQECDALAPPV